MRDLINDIGSIRRRDVPKLLHQGGIFIALVVILLQVIAFISASDATLVAVLSGSMEPGYYRGDILLLHHLQKYPVTVGDIIVFDLEGRDIPIVHRVHRTHTRTADGVRLLRTKGDNNFGDDKVLYPMQRDWIEDKHIRGKTFAYVPGVGHLSLMMSEWRIVKVFTLVVIALFLIQTILDEDG